MAVIVDSPDELVDELLKDLVDRSGFSRWWVEVKEDVRQEIRETWIKIIEES